MAGTGLETPPRSAIEYCFILYLMLPKLAILLFQVGAHALSREIASKEAYSQRALDSQERLRSERPQVKNRLGCEQDSKFHK